MTRSNSAGSIRRRLIRSTALAGGVIGIAAASPAVAQVTVAGTVTSTSPSGGTGPTFDSSVANTTTITMGANRTVINWSSFDLTPTQTLNFVVSANSDAVLNRVIGASASSIDGSLNSYIGAVGGTRGGQIWILNPNGVLFGSNAVIDVGGLVASTHSITDADFLNGPAYSLTGGALTGVMVSNGAQLMTRNGPLALLGGFVANAGTLNASGHVVMAAASEIDMNLAPGSPLSMTIRQGTLVSGTAIDAGGTITGANVYMAVASQSDLLNSLLNVSGTVTANGAAASGDGDIVLLAGPVSATGITVAAPPPPTVLTQGAARILLSAGSSLTASRDVEMQTSGSVTGTGTISSSRNVSGVSNGFAAGRVTAGGNISLNGGASGIGAGGQDLDLSAGGNITTTGAARGRDIALAAGGTITSGSLTARDDVVVNATGNATLGQITTGATVDALAAIDAAGAADTLAAATLAGNDGILTSAATLSITAAGNFADDLSMTAANFSGAGAFSHFVGDDLSITDTAGGLDITSDVSANGTISLTAANGGNLTITDRTITSVNEGVQLAATGGGFIRLDSSTVTAATSVGLSGPTLIEDVVSISGNAVTFGGTLNANGGDADTLSITAAGGTTFNNVVGGTNALETLTVTGPATLNATGITTANGMSFGALTVTGPATLNAGSGVLQVNGAITTTVAGSSLSLNGSSVSVGNVGTSATRFGNIDFLAATTLSGDIWSNSHVQFNESLRLTGAGDRSITAASAAFGDPPGDSIDDGGGDKDDVYSATAGQTGLAVTTTGDTDFNGSIGAGGALRALGVRAFEFNMDLLDNAKVGIVAINVQQGDITFENSDDLTIGTVGTISGLETLSGNITVTVSDNNGNNANVPNLMIEGQVSASGSVSLAADGTLTGSALNNISGTNISLSAGGGVGDGTSDLNLAASGNITITGEARGIDIALRSTGGSVTTEALNARDDVVIAAAGSVTTGSITSGATVGANGPVESGSSADALATALAGVPTTLTGHDVQVTGVGVTTGAIRANGPGSDVGLNGGAGGIGHGSRDLDVVAGGDISLTGAARGRDIALDAAGTVSTGTLTARDDVVVDAGGNATLGTITSGATVDALAAVDVSAAADTLAGATLVGADGVLTSGATLSFGSGSLFADDFTVTAADLGTFLSDPLFVLTVNDALSITDTSGDFSVSGLNSNGTLTLRALSGNLTVANIGSTTGNVVLSSANGPSAVLTLAGNVTTGTGAGRSVTLTSSGSINQTGGGITTHTLTGSAVGSASLLGANVLTNFSGFSANGLGLNVLGGLTIDNLVNGGSYLTLTTNGDLVINAEVRALNGPVTLAANGAGSDITLNGNVNAGLATGTGSVSLTAGGTINQLSGAITGASLSGSAGGSAALTSGTNDVATLNGFTANGLTFNDLGGLTISGAVNGAAGGVAIATTGADGTLTVNGAVSTTTGALSLNSSEAMTVNAAASSTSGAITLSSGHAMTLNAAVSSAAPVTLTTENGSINVAAGGINGTSVALTANGTSSDISIGAAVNGSSVTLDADRDVALGAGVTGASVALHAGRDIAQTGAGVVTAGTLTGSAGGSANLFSALNQVGTLGAFTGTNGFRLRDAGGLVIQGGAVTGGGSTGLEIESSGTIQVNSAVNGGPVAIRATGGASDIQLAAAATGSSVSLNAGGGIGLGANVGAGSGTVSLTAGGAINQSAGIITAGLLTGSSGGATSLTGANQVAALGDFSASSFSFNDARHLDIEGDVTTNGAVAITAIGIDQGAASVVNSNGAAISLDADGSDMDLRGSLQGGAVQIVDAGNVALGNVSAASLALGTAAQTITGAVSQNSGTAIAVSTLTGDVAGATLLRNAGNQIGTLGNFTGGSLALNDSNGVLLINGTVDLTGALELVSAGSIQQTGGTIRTSGLSGSSSGGAIFALAGNQIAGIGVFPGGTVEGFTNSGSGGLALATTTGLALTRNISAGSGDLNLTVAGALTGPTATISAGNNLTATAASMNIGTATATTGALGLTTSAGSLSVGTATSGTTANLNAGASTLTAGTVTAGTGLTATGGSIDIGTATATAGALALTASSGQLRLGTGNAGTTVTLVKQGSTDGLLVTGTVTGQGDVTVKTSTNAALKKLESKGGNILVEALDGSVTGAAGTDGADLVAGPGATSVTVKVKDWARLGEVSANVVTIEAAQVQLSGTMTGREKVDLVNTGTFVTKLGSAADSGGFSLSEEEVNNIVTPTLSIQSGTKDVAIGALAFDSAAGSSRINLLTTGRIDVTGAVSTLGTGTSRTVQIGGSAAGTGEASHLFVNTGRVSDSEPNTNGRLLMDQSVLELRAGRIAVGQSDMLGEFAGMTDEAVFKEIGHAGSKIYRATRLYEFVDGAPPVLVSASSMTITYGNYAVFQNSALPNSIPAGVVIGSQEAQGTLTLNSTGSDKPNGFSMSGEINGRKGVETAVLGPTFIITNGVNFNNSRINGCLVGSGGNCIINIVATPMFNPFDEAMADVLSTGGELTLSLDPVVGANNEALFSGISSVGEAAEEEECDSEDNAGTCPVEEGAQ